MRVRIVRATLCEGSRVLPGEELEVPEEVARVLIYCHKAVPVAPPAREAVAEAREKAVSRGGKRKGGK